MKAKYKIGDKVTPSNLYYEEGYERFGKSLKYQRNPIMDVIGVFENNDNTMDYFGNTIPTIYNVEVRGKVESFCERFLARLY